MKIRIYKEEYTAPSGAKIAAHWIEFNTEHVEVILDNDEAKLYGVEGFPYSWQIPLKGKMEIKSISKNKFG